MPTYRVYEVQEEISTRKWLYEVAADSEDEAIEKVMSGEAEPVEQGTIGEPDYAISGWSSRPTGTVDDETAWKEAVTDLEARRLM